MSNKFTATNHALPQVTRKINYLIYAYANSYLFQRIGLLLKFDFFTGYGRPRIIEGPYV